MIVGYVFHSWELLGMWAWTPAFVAAALAVQGTGAERAAGLGATLSALPLLLVFVVANRRIVEGVRVSGLKG